MEAGMRGNSATECKVAMEFCIATVAMSNTRAPGITACLMERVSSISKMAKSMKGHSRRTSSMGMEFFTKTTLPFTEFGRTISFRL